VKFAPEVEPKGAAVMIRRPVWPDDKNGGNFDAGAHEQAEETRREFTRQNESAVQ
jgi:hypothetical protein